MLIDNAGHEMGLSGLRTRPPSFKNALVQNIAGGNTMVFNKAARDVLLSGGAKVRVVVHDWWTYMAVSGAGGVVINDPAPSLKYRQHEGNQIGSNHGLAARIVRAIRLLQGGFRQWTDINMNALPAIESHLTPENRQAFRQFCAIRAAPLVPRLIGLFRSGIYRQTTLDNLGLYLAAALNRL